MSRGTREKSKNGIYHIVVVRYIHRNSVKAQIAKQAEQWRWSSRNDIMATEFTHTDYSIMILY